MTQQQIDEQAAEERREYFRQWRAANKDRVKAHNANYWRKRAESRLKAEQGSKEGELNGKVDL